MLSEVCKDVSTDLQPLTGEHYQHRTAITTDDARVNVKARGFCRKGQTAFFLFIILFILFFSFIFRSALLCFIGTRVGFYAPLAQHFEFACADAHVS